MTQPVTESNDTLDLAAIAAGTMSGDALLRSALGDDFEQPAGEDAPASPEEPEAELELTPDGEDAEQDAEADDSEEEQPDADVQGYVDLLGHIEAVFNDQSKLAAVPAPLKPIVASAANAILANAQNAASSAYEQGVTQGERFAILNELYVEDREAFDAEIAKDPETGARFHEWKAKVARAAGLNDEETQATRAALSEVLSELDEHPEAKARVVEQGRQQGLFTVKSRYQADLRKMTRLVDRELLRMETAPAPVVPTSAQPANDRAANAQRLRNLPKPDVGGGSEASRSLLSGVDLNAPGTGSKLLDDALREGR